MEERLAVIASRFALDGEILDITPDGEGFINDTYRIRTGSSTPDYILQRKNGVLQAVGRHVEIVAGRVDFTVAEQPCDGLHRNVFTLQKGHIGMAAAVR